MIYYAIAISSPIATFYSSHIVAFRALQLVPSFVAVLRAFFLLFSSLGRAADGKFWCGSIESQSGAGRCSVRHGTTM